MKSFHADQLVTVTLGDEQCDGLVLEPQGLTKVVVVATDGVFHTLHPKYVAVRDQPGPDDDHLRDLTHRARTRGGRAAASPGGHGRDGFSAPVPHRRASR